MNRRELGVVCAATSGQIRLRVGKPRLSIGLPSIELLGTEVLRQVRKELEQPCPRGRALDTVTGGASISSHKGKTRREEQS